MNKNIDKMQKTLNKYKDHLLAMTWKDVIMVILIPAIYQYMKGKDGNPRTFASLLQGKWEGGEGVLALITVADIIIIALNLLFRQRLNFICMVAWVAVSVYVWLELIFAIARED